jgi:tRNA U34 2-thiouridine synthase MnmA/TrmU
MTSKALVMVSGGLDSMLAAKILLSQGIEVIGVHFTTGFGIKKDDHETAFAIAGNLSASPQARHLAETLAIPLHSIDFSQQFFQIVQNPRHGYGANMNPCIDCKILMFSFMKKLMAEFEAQFFATGEVLGQRPMTQHRQTLKLIEREGGVAGLVLRPLSAGLLDPTIPETKGWVDRSRLYSVSGRSRKPQIVIAQELGLKQYPQPAGGCCHLINPEYSRRMRDLLRYKKNPDLSKETALLLNIGRQFRLSSGIKVIVGRDDKENGFLENYRAGRHFFRVVGYPAATALAEIDGEAGSADLETLASIALRYSDAPPETKNQVEYAFDDRHGLIETVAASGKNLDRWRI